MNVLPEVKFNLRLMVGNLVAPLSHPPSCPIPFSEPRISNTFKSPVLASNRSGTVSRVRCFSSPEERPDDRLVFAVTSSHPTLSLPKPKAPYEEKPNRVEDSA